MPNNEDFFSPDHIDEQLEFSRMLPGEEAISGAADDANLLLMHDLRKIYRREGAETRHSLQNVWERLERAALAGQDAADASALQAEDARHLRVLEHARGRTPSSIQPLKQSRRWRPDRLLVALVASLFIVAMIGSTLLARHALPGFSAGNPLTATPAQARSIPGYSIPGKNIATSPSSPDGFSTLSWSPDGKELATITQNAIWIWNLRTGRYQQLPSLPLTTKSSQAQSLSWSPDGRYLAVGTNPISVIDMLDEQPVFSFPVYRFWPTAGNDDQALVTSVAWSADSTMLAIAAVLSNNGCVIQVRRVSQPDQVWKSIGCQTSSPGLDSISWSSDGKYIASAGPGQVQVWSLSTGQAVFLRDVLAITDVAWSPVNPSRLAFVQNGTAQVWDVGESQLISDFAPAVNGILTWSPNGSYLATADDNQIAVWRAQTGALIYIYSGNIKQVGSLAWSPDGASLAAGESSGAFALNVVHVWST